MTTRERILLIGMGGVLVWAGTSVLLSMRPGAKSQNKYSLINGGIRHFAETQRTLIAPLRLTEAERRILAQAILPWADSPFVDRTGESAIVEAPTQQFSYSGYLRVGEAVFAIINGREYRVSESVGDSGFSLESIKPDHVVLIAEGGKRRMTLPLETEKQ